MICFTFRRRANLVVVFHILPDDAALIVDILNPLDVFVAAARRLALLGEWRQAGEDENRNARFAPRCAPLRRATGCRSRRARRPLGRDPSVVRSHVQLIATISFGQVTMAGIGRPEGPRLGDRLDESGMIAAEIGEDVGDARFPQRLEHRRAGAIHSNDSQSFALLDANAQPSFARRTARRGPQAQSSSGILAPEHLGKLVRGVRQESDIRADGGEQTASVDIVLGQLRIGGQNSGARRRRP